MIKNLDDLQKFVLNDLDDKEELIFQRLRMMTSPGCNNEEIEEIKTHFPGIPQSYLECVQEVNLNGITVGHFAVCPASYAPEGMVANLIKGNEEGVLGIDYAQKYKMYSVASDSFWTICVATVASPFPEGEIVSIDENIYGDEENEARWIFPIAQNFEQFLLLAGNLNQISRKRNDVDNSTREDRQAEYLECMKALGVDPKYRQIWLDQMN